MRLKINRIIAIQNHGPSGSTLMHSLLDDHPNIMSLPWLYGLPLYYIWDENLKDKKITFKFLKEIIITKVGVLFDPNLENGDPSLSHMGEEENVVIKVDKEEFFKNLKDYFDSSNDFIRKDFIISIYQCFNKAYKKEFNNECHLCFPIHDQPKKHALYLKEDFDQLRFIHMVRSPVQTIGSIIKHINHNQQKFSLFKSMLFCAISNIILERREHWEEDSVKLYGKTPYIEDCNNIKSRYVRLEDVHLDNKKTMQKVCSFLGIDHFESLSKSTFMGFTWHNRAESVKSSGIGKNTISQKHSIFLSAFDKYRLKLLCKNEFIYFGYGKFGIIDTFILIILPILIFFPFNCDISPKREFYRFKAMLKMFSNDKQPIIEWIFFDSVVNTLPGAELIKMRKINNNNYIAATSLIVSFPIYILRVIMNYINLRVVMLNIWLMILLRKTKPIKILSC